MHDIHFTLFFLSPLTLSARGIGWKNSSVSAVGRVLFRVDVALSSDSPMPWTWTSACMPIWSRFSSKLYINYSPNLNDERSLDLLWAFFFFFFFFLGFLSGLCWSSVTSKSALLSLSDEESSSSTEFQISYGVKEWWIGYILAIFFLFRFNWSSVACDSDSLSLSNDSADVVQCLLDSGTESATEPWVDGSSLGDVREEVFCGSLAAFTKFLWDASWSVPMLSSFSFWAGWMVCVGQLEAILRCCDKKLIIYNSANNLNFFF